MDMNKEPNGVVLITIEVCTPYKAGEIATFDRITANKLLTQDRDRNPIVKWRKANAKEIAEYHAQVGIKEEKETTDGREARSNLT